MAACTHEQIKAAVADWAGVPQFHVTSDTVLDGLGGKSWPEDAAPLISSLEQICQCGSIPSSEYSLWQKVKDIEDYMDGH